MQQTVRAPVLKRASDNSFANACLIYIYPVGPEIGSRRTLDEDPTIIGREPDCEICLNDTSVSRRHVRIELTPDGYCVEDLRSTNGTFVNEIPVTRTLLRDGDYLRVGACIFRYLSGGNVEAEYHQVIYRLSIVDALTDINNKRYLLDFLEREVVHSQRYRQPLSLVMFDLDRFKSINDSMGHLAGDYTLREVAGRIKPIIRRDELFARYGGEEFTVVLPAAQKEDAVCLAERLREVIAATPFSFEGQKFTVTISLGIATTQGDPELNVAKLLQLADENLYQAKRSGRNRVVS